jgi:hypothetical protein
VQYFFFHVTGVLADMKEVMRIRFETSDIYAVLKYFLFAMFFIMGRYSPTSK